MFGFIVDTLSHFVTAKYYERVIILRPAHNYRQIDKIS